MEATPPENCEEIVSVAVPLFVMEIGVPLLRDVPMPGLATKDTVAPVEVAV